MSKPYFRSSPEQVPRRGATSSKAGLDVPRRVAALEQGAGHRLAPSVYCASMYIANSGTPNHSNPGGYQKVGGGSSAGTWTSEYDYRPTGVGAQVDTATNKRIDIRRAGLYIVTASISLASVADAKILNVAVYKGGAAVLYDQRTTGGSATAIVSVSAPLLLVAGDYLELYAFNGDSVNRNYGITAATMNRLTATLIGPPA